MWCGTPSAGALAGSGHRQERSETRFHVSFASSNAADLDNLKPLHKGLIPPLPSHCTSFSSRPGKNRSSATGAVAPRWAQCGGLGSAPTPPEAADAPWPSATCAGGCTCKRVNAYYYQCTPAHPPQPPSGAGACCGRCSGLCVVYLIVYQTVNDCWLHLGRTVSTEPCLL